METTVGYNYDLAVCYRIYPRVSGQPVFALRDKFALTRLNLEAFREAAGGLRLKMWVLLDNCPPAYRKVVTEIFAGRDIDIVTLGGEGNWATFRRQIDILCRQEASEFVYFAEDDYLYTPLALERGLSFLTSYPEADALTLADHRAYHYRYVDRICSRQHVQDEVRWRTVVATALTFMTRRQVLIETQDVLRTYCIGNSDLGLWMALTKLRVFNPWCLIRGFGDGIFIPGSLALAWWHAWRQICFGKRRTLWAPSPTLATHMETNDLAPGADWESLWGARAMALQH